MIVIFDLDGTLALIDHRRPMVEGVAKPDWDAFFLACGDDKVNEPVADIFRMMKDAGHTVWVFSGRGKIAEQETVDWLYFNDLFPDKLVMRDIGDHQPDDRLKKSWLEKHLPTKISREQLLCVFDDRQKVVDMWRSNGVACMQVAPGDF